MNANNDTTRWIDAQAETMRRRVEQWSAINTGSMNRAGIERLSGEVLEAFTPLGGKVRRVALPPYEIVDDLGRLAAAPLADALVITKRPDAPRRALLVIHLDTVYAHDHPFQKVETADGNTLRGPGVADAKGGLAVMLTALEALERSDRASDLGWRVVLNPDEELGSPGSAGLLVESARRAHVGLVYEPTLPDGAMISRRKGSGNYTAVVRGRAAHVGRHFHEGRSAIHALAELISELNALNDELPGVLVNTGRIAGGGPVNVVPDCAIARFNIRVDATEDQRAAEQYVRRCVDRLSQRDGIDVTVHGGFGAPPKPLNDAMQRMMEQVADCGEALGIAIHWQPSGGVCDGNRLAAAGLPTVDTLGPCGGDIHSPNEYLVLDSLTQRAKLSATLLLKYAAGELEPPTASQE